VMRALNFWATVLEMDWHKENGRNCSIQILAGARSLFQPAEAARAQFPDRPAFQGWIAFNPHERLSEDEKFLVAVHELGHLFGLPHNRSARSVMYFACLEGPVFLDAADLAALAIRHKLRSENLKEPLVVSPGAFIRGEECF